MPSYGVTFKEPPSPRLRKLIASLDAKDYRDPIGVAAVKALKEHFAARNANPAAHRSAFSLGAQPSDLYMKFADATSFTPTESGVEATISHPAVRQRLQGGTIRPVNVRHLTIPANSNAYGRRAGTVGVALKFMFAFDEARGCWRPALVAPDAVTKPTGAPRKDGSRRQRTIRPAGIYFWLVKSVTQQPDAEVLPNRDALLNSIVDALKSWSNGIMGRN